MAHILNERAELGLSNGPTHSILPQSNRTDMACFARMAGTDMGSHRHESIYIIIYNII